MTQKTICLYLHVHQPYRLTKLNYLDLGQGEDYFEGSGNAANSKIISKVAAKSYLPTNALLLKLLKKVPNFKLTLSLTGVVIEQFKKFAPEILVSFQRLVDTGKVEILSETYYHSLASIYDLEEFTQQVSAHRELIKKEFDFETSNFRNTELIYSDQVGAYVKELGFKAVLAEGWDKYLQHRQSSFVYNAHTSRITPSERKILANTQFKKPATKLKLLLKHYRLSDDIAFRFSDPNWPESPLSVEKYLSWVQSNPGPLINLFMDYETFGEHQWAESGIFSFLKELVESASSAGINFASVEDIATSSDQDLMPTEDLSMPNLTSWADAERDISAWNGNKLQQSALRMLYGLKSKLAKVNQPKYYEIWRKLQISDHFYYMSTKYWTDGDVHKYFSPYDSPYEAFINFMNIMEDFSQKLDYILRKK